MGLKDREPAKRAQGGNAGDLFSEDALRAAAMRYLTRYAATAQQVTRVLQRRLIRHGQDGAADPDVVNARIDRIVARLAQAGLLNDADYAAMKATSLLRRGTSTRQILGTLRDKGVPDDIAKAALATLDETHGEDRERRAALRYAQRRGLGPWAKPDRRALRRQRDIAAMVRAGYPAGLATWTVDCDRESAEAVLSGGFT